MRNDRDYLEEGRGGIQYLVKSLDQFFVYLMVSLDSKIQFDS